MNPKYYESDIPTNRIELLDQLIGRKIKKILRYSWWTPEKSADECNIRKEDVFSLTAGPIYIEFDTGISIGASSQPSLSSIEIWLEQCQESKRSELLSDDSELYPINIADNLYSTSSYGEIVGSRLVKYEIIKKEPINSLLWELPREVALVLYFSNGVHLILSHGLHDNSDDFSVLQWGQVDKSIFETLYKTSNYWK